MRRLRRMRTGITLLLATCWGSRCPQRRTACDLHGPGRTPLAVTDPHCRLILFGPFVGWGLTARPCIARWLAAVTLLPVAMLTLVPVNRQLSVRCEVAWSIPTVGRVELAANVVLFVAPVLLASVATRRPMLVGVAASGLSAAVEAIKRWSRRWAGPVPPTTGCRTPSVSSSVRCWAGLLCARIVPRFRTSAHRRIRSVRESDRGAPEKTQSGDRADRDQVRTGLRALRIRMSGAWCLATNGRHRVQLAQSHARPDWRTPDRSAPCLPGPTRGGSFVQRWRPRASGVDELMADSRPTVP